MNKLKERYYSGISGLVLPVAKSQYPGAYRDRSRLSYFASLYNSIEINSIFYKLPRPSTIANWVADVPDDFRFTFKLSKSVTHVKGLKFQASEIDLFMKTIEPAVQKKGCLLIQFPPGLKFEMINQLSTLLEYLGEANREQQWPLAVEFRNNSWDESEVSELLNEYNAARVIHDLKGSAPISQRSSTKLKYLRFHGPEGTYRGSYPDHDLLRYAEHIKKWLQQKETVFVYFNNTMGEASANLHTLNRMVMQDIK